MNDDEDSRSNDQPGPSRSKSNDKRRSNDKEPVTEEDMKVFDQKLIYHTYLAAQELKEDERYREMEFNGDTLARISGIVKAVFTEKWLPELNSFSEIKNRGAEDADIPLLFRNNPDFLQLVVHYTKEYEGEEEDDDEEDENAEEGVLEEHNEDLGDVKIKTSRPQTPAQLKKKKSESPSSLITDYFTKSADKPTTSTTPEASESTTPITPEPPFRSAFASSKRPASDAANETPAKISKIDESITETQALKMCHTPGDQMPQISRANNKGMPSTPTTSKPPSILPRPRFAESHLAASTSAQNSIINPGVATQKQPLPPPPPKKDDYDSFDDDEIFIEAEIKKPLPPKPAGTPLGKKDSFFDENVDEIIASKLKNNAGMEKKMPGHHSVAASIKTSTSTVSKSKAPITSKPLPRPVITKKDSFFDDEPELVQKVQSKTLPKVPVQKKDSFDDEDSDIIFLDLAPVKSSSSKPAAIPPPSQTSKNLKIAPTKMNPLSDSSNTRVQPSPLKHPPGGFSFED